MPGISGLSVLFSNRNLLLDKAQELARLRNDDNAEADAVTLEASPGKSTPPRSDSSSVMSGNFFDAAYSKSKYVQAQLDAKKSDREFSNRMDAVVSTLFNEMQLAISQRQVLTHGKSVFGASSEAYKTYIKAPRRVLTVVEDEVQEKAKEHLKATREDIEKAAEAALEAATSPDAVVQDAHAVGDAAEKGGAENSAVKEELRASVVDADTSFISEPASSENIPIPQVAVESNSHPIKAASIQLSINAYV